MAAVIRLKRRVDEDPLNAFVLNCKRQRTGEFEQQEASANGSGEISTVLKFAGTFTKADNISTHLQQRISKEEAKEVISRVHRPTIASRRAASRQSTQNSRFRIVNCTRSLSQVEGVEATTTIVDVERDIIAAAAAASSTTAGTDAKLPSQSQQEEEQGYVYDLYVADESQQQTHIPYIPDNLDDISVAIYDDPLFASHRGLGDRSDSMGEESEDSNDENNWRNDYPDEDEDGFGENNSVNEEDIRRAVEDFDLEGDRELSSDDDVYGDAADTSGYAYPINDDDVDADEYQDEEENEVNPKDVARFGTAYARYKARIIKQMEKKSSDDDEYDSDIDAKSESRSSSASGSESENFDLYD